MKYIVEVDKKESLKTMKYGIGASYYAKLEKGTRKKES